MSGSAGVPAAGRKPPEAPIRERLIVAAIDFTVTNGWAELTMAKLASLVGVSRQTVYNELGKKPQLAQAMVLHELARFLAKVEKGFLKEPDDVIRAVELAARSALEMGEKSPLLRAVLTARQGAESDLLPLLTTHSAAILDTARIMITEHVLTYDLPLERERLDTLIDMVVRLVLSHIMQPGGSPKETAAAIAWIAAQVLELEHAGF
ncbi:MAG: TetR/AcrR family transcriptional regulator [Marmoricola sp.]